jgi:hypothetical protein
MEAYELRAEAYRKLGNQEAAAADEVTVRRLETQEE